MSNLYKNISIAYILIFTYLSLSQIRVLYTKTKSVKKKVNTNKKAVKSKRVTINKANSTIYKYEGYYLDISQDLNKYSRLIFKNKISFHQRSKYSRYFKVFSGYYLNSNMITSYKFQVINNDNIESEHIYNKVVYQKYRFALTSSKYYYYASNTIKQHNTFYIPTQDNNYMHKYKYNNNIGINTYTVLKYFDSKNNTFLYEKKINY